MTKEMILGKEWEFHYDWQNDQMVLFWGGRNIWTMSRNAYLASMKSFGGDIQKFLLNTITPFWVMEQGSQNHGLSEQSASPTASGAAGQSGPGQPGNSAGQTAGAVTQQAVSNALNQLQGLGASAAQSNASYQQLLQQFTNQCQQQKLIIRKPNKFNLAGRVEPAKPLPVEKILIGEIIGWRAWRLNANDLLGSFSQAKVWVPGEPMVARKVPSGDGEGVYAFKSKRLLYDFVWICEREWHDERPVLGQVHLWGNVVEHELGYRAEFASIVSLFDGPKLAELRKRYQLVA